MRKITVALLLASAAGAHAQPFDATGFTRRMPILFNGYAGGETLSNFPALVKINPAVSAEIQPETLRFSDAAGTELFYEIDTWDSAGESLVWVRVPSLTPGALLHAHWGHPSATAPAYATDGSTWTNDYLLVQHYNGNVADSSPAKRAVTVEAGAAYPAGGIIGQNFNLGNNNTRAVLAANVLVINARDTPSAWTIGTWFKQLNPGGSGVYRTLMGLSSNLIVPILISGDGKLGGYGTPGITKEELLVDTTPVWRHLTTVYTPPQMNGTASGIFTYYVNGKWVQDLTGTLSTNANEYITQIGTGWGGNQQFAKYLDEFRVENRARSAVWIQAGYDTVANPAFAVCGAPADADGSEPVHTLAAINLSYDSADIIGLLDATATAPHILRLSYSEDGGNWSDLPPFTIAAPGFFTNTISGLTPDTHYFARYALETSPGVFVDSPGSVAFTTTLNPLPILGAVTLTPGAAASSVGVEVEQTGIESLLIFMWDTADRGDVPSAWANVSTNDNPKVETVNTFANALPGFLPGDSIAWRVALTGTGNKTAWKSGVFTINREYTFIPSGAGGAYQWNYAPDWLNVASNQSDDGIPNFRGDIARVIAGSSHSVNQTLNLGAQHTVGGFEFGMASITLAGAGPLVFDNGLATAVVEKNGIGNSIFNLPVVLQSPLLITNQTATAVQFHNTVTPRDADTGITIPLCSFVWWNPPADTAFEAGIRGGGGFGKRGDKTLTLRGTHVMHGGLRENTIRTDGSGLPNGYGLVEYGSLIFDGGVFTNTASGDGHGRLFSEGCGTLVLSNGCQAVSLKQVAVGYNYSFDNRWTNNTLVVTGAGTLLDMTGKTLILHGETCALRVVDNARVHNIYGVLTIGTGGQPLGRNKMEVLDGAEVEVFSIGVNGLAANFEVNNATFKAGIGGFSINSTGNRCVITNNSVFSVAGNGMNFSSASTNNTTLFVDNNTPASVAGLTSLNGFNNTLAVEKSELVFQGGFQTTDSGVGTQILVKKGGVIRTRGGLAMYNGGNVRVEVDGGELHSEGARLQMPTPAANTTNILCVSNGGYFKNLHTGWETVQSNNSKPGYLRIESVGADPETGRPSLLEPVNGSVTLTTNTTLRAAHGGVIAVTNGTATITMADHSAPGCQTVLATAGGEIHVNALQFTGSGNGLAPEVTIANGTGCVTVRGTATFGADTWVWPSAEKGAPAGEHLILTAGALNAALLDLAPGVDRSVWRLRVCDVEKNKLYLRYSRGGTLFMVR